MSVGFVYLRPLRVVAVKAHGPYVASAHEAWRQMFAWLDDSGMRREVGRGYGLMRHDPKLTPEEKCRYEACIELLAGYESMVPAGFDVTTLPGGAYARRRHSGSDLLRSTIASLRDDWVPSQGLHVDPRRPFIEIYCDNPIVVAAEARKIDVCIPVSMAPASPHIRPAV